jgi:hypothetical protein
VRFYLFRTLLTLSKSFARNGRSFEPQSGFREKLAFGGASLPIRTEFMAQYVREMQVRLGEKKIGYKRNFYERFRRRSDQR